MTTANEYLEKIEADAATIERLNRNITDLLNAGWNTVKIADALCRQQSFGKFVGCHREALLAIANETCRKLNRSERQAMAEAWNEFKENCPIDWRGYLKMSRAFRR